jgi:hypothetical protein
MSRCHHDLFDGVNSNLVETYLGLFVVIGISRLYKVGEYETKHPCSELRVPCVLSGLSGQQGTGDSHGFGIHRQTGRRLRHQLLNRVWQELICARGLSHEANGSVQLLGVLPDLIHVSA